MKGLAATLPIVNLFTTDRNCSVWPYRSAWQQAGYASICMDSQFQRIMVHSYCKHTPSEPIQYSDISRLLILYKQGGWYVDSDVEPTSLSTRLHSLPNTTFGLESDFSVDTAKEYGMLPQSIAMWAIFGIKGDERLKDMACTLAYLSSEPKPSFELFTDYIFRTSGPTAQTRLWQGAVLPVNVFGCGQAHSHSPPCTAVSCWGCHKFSGSWRQAVPKPDPEIHLDAHWILAALMVSVMISAYVVKNSCKK